MTCFLQVDYYGVAAGNRGLPEAAERLNRGFAWMYTMRGAEAAGQGLGNCVWVLDDAAKAGGLVCVHHGQTRFNTLLGLASNATNSSSGRNSSSSMQLLRNGRRLAGAAAATAAGAVTAATASSTTGRSSRWVLVPANGKLQLQLFLDGKVKRQVVGVAGKLTWVDVGDTADALQVQWPQGN